MRNAFEDASNGFVSLDQIMADGPMPLPEALRYAALLAEEIRQIHDAGRTCGALRPSAIEVTPSGPQLGNLSTKPAVVTPYTAPEILQGHAPDAGSDIFAFGAILYEMVAGRPAFSGENADALAVSLTISDPPPTGTPGIDHLVGKCIAKDPAVRCRRIHKVILEMKLLTFAAPRAAVVTRQQQTAAELRAETQQLEHRVSELFQNQGKTIVEIQQASGGAITELRERVSKLELLVGPLQARSALVESLCQRIMAHVEQVQQKLDAIDERVNGVRSGMDDLSQGASMLHDYVGTRMHEFEQTVGAQRTAIASVAAGQAQTDDLIEGIVGAVDLLNHLVINPPESFGETRRDFEHTDSGVHDENVLSAV
jgi:hypothetical protein